MTVMVALVLRGIYLTDLTFIEDGTPRPPSFPCVVSRLLRARWLTHWLVHTGNPDGSLNYLINFKKRELVYDVIREIEQYQVRTTRIAPVRAARFIVFTHARTHARTRITTPQQKGYDFPMDSSIFNVLNNLQTITVRCAHHWHKKGDSEPFLLLLLTCVCDRFRTRKSCGRSRSRESRGTPSAHPICPEPGRYR
jgi:hypothetical protein